MEKRKQKDKKPHKKAKMADELRKIQDTELIEEIIDLTKSEDPRIRLKAT